MRKWSIASALVAVMLLLGSVSGQQQPAPDTFVAGELLVKFNPGMNAAQRNNILSGRRAARIRRFASLDIEHIRVPQGLSVQAAIDALRSIPGVMLVQPNYKRHAIQSVAPPPNDPSWLDGSLWGLLKIQAQEAWTNFTPGDGSVVVAGIDTGIDYTHPDLAANMWHNPGEIPDNGVDDDGNGYVDDVYGIDTVNHTSDPFDDQGHGTHTAGTIAAVGNNGQGVTGVSWNTKLLACKFLDASGSGDDAGAIECFNYVVALKNRGVNIRVTSNSWGQQRGSDPPSTLLQAAIDAAGNAGIISIFGAGNDGTNNDTSPFDPASYPIDSIVSVASSGPTDRRSFFSNYGATSVDLAAPGEGILSTYPFGGYETLDGTSMATPHVAGVAALLATMNPDLSVGDIKALLLDNVDQSSRWTGRVLSGGRLNAFKAASAVGAGNGNVAPSVSLDSPVEGAIYKAPATIPLAASAFDTDGEIRQVAFYANGFLVATDTTAPYSAVWTGVSAGNYTVTAVATDNHFATATSTPVHIVVNPNAPPTVAVTNPIEGATFTSPATVTLEATASDSDGAVSQVSFYANGALIGTDTTSPFSVSWNAPLGSYTVTAVATDNEAATTTSTAVHITVNPIPGRINVALTSSGGVASASSTLSPSYPPSGANNGDRKGLNWGAGGGWNDATPNAAPDWLEVDFNGNKLIEEVNVFSMQDNYSSPADPTPAMTFTSFGLRNFDVQYWTGSDWAVVPGGSVTENNLVWRRVVFAPLATSKLRVFITAALNGSARVMEVEAWGVGAGGNVAPSVSIASPAEGATLTAPADVTITADASDQDGTVASVTFLVNGVPLSTDTTSPFTAAWNGVAAGSYTLTAIATDNQGATTTSTAVHVTAAANVPPSVSISAPSEGATYSAPATVTVSATASDSDGAIASVAFFLNGSPIGTDTTSPYSVSWPNVAAGAYTLTAVATDNRSATTTSAPVHITVNASPGRLNQALAANGGVASASSTYSPNYPASGTINGDRKGLSWGAGGGWTDGTPNAAPDWLEVDFNGNKLIDEVDVFSLQDSYGAPVEPTPALTFMYWGVIAFDVQYWNGSAWATVPGGGVSNNNKVWRQVLFAPVTTTKIRINITAALNGYSRLTEVEAWGTNAAGGPPSNLPPTVSITSPTEGATFTSPASLTVTANAADSDGTVASVAFFANGAPIGTDTTSPFSVAWNNVVAGSYTLTAVATDNQGATTTSAAVHVAVNQPAGRVNVAAAANGGVASASSTYNPSYPASGAINGDRKGLSWGNGGGWNDGTPNAAPDWLEVDFNGSKTIDEVDVFSMQDNYSAPADPTATMTFSYWGLRAFEVQYWNGAAWAPVPGGTVSDNNLVWRKVTFAPITTTKVRVFITAFLNGYSRVIELEAWGVSASEPVAEAELGLCSTCAGDGRFHGQATNVTGLAASLEAEFSTSLETSVEDETARIAAPAVAAEDGAGPHRGRRGRAGRPLHGHVRAS